MRVVRRKSEGPIRCAVPSRGGGWMVRGQRVPMVLVADPPCLMRDALPGKTRGAAKNYRCLRLDQIARFPLPPVVDYAEDAVLFMWRLSSMQEEALMIARAWRFRPHSELVWEKLTTTGKR